MPKGKSITTGAEKLLKSLIYPALGLSAIGSGIELGKPVVRAAQIHNSRNNLTKYNPELKDVDKNIVDGYFNVVKTFSPTAAKNPIVAGNLVNKMVEFGGVDHNLIKGLVDIQKGVNVGNVGSEIVSKGLGTGMGNALGNIITASAMGA